MTVDLVDNFQFAVEGISALAAAAAVVVVHS
jgi:hypothetical protein